MKTIKELVKPLLLILFLLLPISCSKENSTEPAPAPTPTYKNQKLDDAFNQAGKFSGLKSLVVSQNGVILKEAYYGSGGADIPHDVRSVTKTVTSLLVGIAIREGCIRSVDETIGEITPAIPSDKAGIKVKDLLTMSGGFSWNELSQVSEYINWFNSSNQVNYVLSRPLVAQPGHVFNYNSAALHLLSAGITLTSNMSTLAFANKYLFNDLGITISYWEQDHQGNYNGAAGLNITPHDMIKIGNLILNRGVSNGKQIVPAEWIDEMVKPQISTNNAQPYGSGYGYGIWTGLNSKGNYAWANGFGGQFIVIIPSQKLVIVATNEWNNVSSDLTNSRWNLTINLIMNNVLNAFD